MYRHIVPEKRNPCQQDMNIKVVQSSAHVSPNLRRVPGGERASIFAHKISFHLYQ